VKSLKRPYFYYSDKRKIVPVASEELHIQARDILRSIRRKKIFKNIPKEYQDEWKNVSLFHTKGEIEKADSIILDPERGSYSFRNKLNHLEGKSWTKFTKSWFVFDALSKDLKEEKEITAKAGLNAEEHPATYSPSMMEDFIKFFTKENEIVFDPFSGIGSTLVACDRTNRMGIGIEINKKYCQIIKLRTRSKVIHGDSKKVKKLLKKHKVDKIDFCISSPPYWDILNRSTGKFSKIRSSKNLDINYSSFEEDIGNISDYKEFLSILSNIYLDIFSFIKPGGYLVVIVKNLKKSGKHYPLAWDLAKNLETKYTLKDEKIWCQDQVGLAPFGYPFGWTSNIVHHYCLIFKKDE
jgi:DNA modification methylase